MTPRMPEIGADISPGTSMLTRIPAGELPLAATTSAACCNIRCWSFTHAPGDDMPMSGSGSSISIVI